MRRLFSLLASLMLVIALMAGATAHAAEFQGPVAHEASDGCREASSQQKKGSPADAEKMVVHHHGCHGHHVGIPIAPTSVAERVGFSREIPLLKVTGRLFEAPKGMFRPPIA